MGHKIITEEDFWICSEGAIPTPFQGTRSSNKTPDGKVYITVEDTSTVSWIDFGCKKYMFLAAIIAAAAVVVAVAVGILTVATGGMGLVMLGAIAGVAGGVIGAVMGGLLCGQKMGGARKWLGSKSNFISTGAKTITGEHQMECKAGGVIKYAPNIKSWLGAFGYTGVSYGAKLTECFLMGALIGTGGQLLGVGAITGSTTTVASSTLAGRLGFARAWQAAQASGGSLGTGISLSRASMVIAKTTGRSILRNIGATFGTGIGSGGLFSSASIMSATLLGSRVLHGSEAVAHDYALGEENTGTLVDSAAKGFLPEYELGNRIYTQGISGLRWSDSMFLLYALNVRALPKGMAKAPSGRVYYTRNNPWKVKPGTKVPNENNPLYDVPPKNGKVYENPDNRRPSWQQSEEFVGEKYPGYETQKSFINGEEVPYGTENSTRPDFYSEGHNHSIEVKNYNVENSSGRSNLKNELVRQYNERIDNLPEGTRQTAEIDTRGQDISVTELVNLRNSINESAPDLEIIFITD